MKPAVLALLLLATQVATPVAAETGPRPLDEAYFGWAADAGLTRPEIAVIRDGVVVLNAGDGVEPGAPRELASLSKAVTAQCAAGLVASGRLRWGTMLTSLRGLQDAPELSVAQLVTQTGGLWPDRTQWVMSLWYGAGPGQGDWHDVAGWPLSSEPGQPGFLYNNENYALLGHVIEAVTGAPLGVACNGVLPGSSLSPQTGAYGPFGGWQAGLADYARFVSTLYSDDAPEGPVQALGGGAVYGLGMFGRERAREGWLWWHLGLLCLPGRLEAGAYALSGPGGRAVVVAFDGCPDEVSLEALDRLLVEGLLDG